VIKQMKKIEEQMDVGVGVDDVERMTSKQASDFWEIFAARLADDDGAAAREHLESGNPIYYCEPSTPDGTAVKHYPNGYRELVTFDETGEHFVATLESEADDEKFSG
jgi:hypothetical protein